MHFKAIAGDLMGKLVDVLQAQEAEKVEAYEKGRGIARTVLEMTSASDKQMRDYAEQFAGLFGVERV
jgi:hypothetical protein